VLADARMVLPPVDTARAASPDGQALYARRDRAVALIIRYDEAVKRASALVYGR